VPPALRSVLKDEHGFLRFASTNDGYLVSADAGEFGGALRWYSSDGTRRVTLYDRPVFAFLVLDTDTIVALSGSRAASRDEVALLWLSRSGDGWARTREAAVEVLSPEAAVGAAGAFFVATPAGIDRVALSGSVEPVARTAWSKLAIASIAYAADGTLWAGAQHYVIAFPSAPGSTLRTAIWAAPAGCKRVRLEGVRCVCDEKKGE
jgi:hypothetical protein